MAATTERGLKAVRAEVRRLLRQYQRAEDETRTPLLRQVAACLVEARSHFLDDEGHPDWRGKTYAYRRWVGELYGEIATGEELKALQAAVRYHISASLRDRLDDDELERLGLMKAKAQDRARDRSAQRRAVLGAISSRDLAGGAMLAITASLDLIRRVDVTELDELPADTAAVALASSRELERLARRWRRRLEARG